MGFQARGKAGTLLAGGRPGAVLGAWTLSTPPKEPGDSRIRWTVQATVTAQDAYWLEAAAAFDLVLPLQKSTWRWRRLAPAQVRLASGGDTVTITGEGIPDDDE